MKDESHAAEASPFFCSQKSDSPSNKYVIQPTAAFAGRTHAHISININLSSSRTALNWDGRARPLLVAHISLQPVAFLGFWLGSLHLDRRPSLLLLSLPLSSLPFPSFAPPSLFPAIFQPLPSLSLDVGPLNPAMGCGGALQPPPAKYGWSPSRN